MQLPALLFSDPHLAAGPSAEYRWGLFPWLAEQCREEKVKTLLCLGDVTDAKDNHGAELTNRVVRAFDGLRAAAPRIVVLMGNHDYLRAGHMYFQFLDALPGIEVIREPREDADVKGEPAFFLPYSKDPARDWAGLDFSHYKYLFMHQTVRGARTSNGQVMEGRDMPALNAGKVYSGDIHVPQTVGAVEYVGSPYHVHLGDAFRPRCVLIERGGRAVDLHFDTLRRVSIRAAGLDELEAKLKILRLRAGDHVKLVLELDAGERHDWRAIRRNTGSMLDGLGLVSHGIELAAAGGRGLQGARSAVAEARTPEQALRRFVEAEGLTGDAYDAGMDVLEDE